MQNQSQSNPMTLRQKIELGEWLSFFPALTVIVFLRRNVGYRMLSPGGIAGVGTLMLLWGGIAEDTDDFGPLSAFAWLFLGVAFCLKARRWREIRQGICGHSFYIGDSILEFLPWPRSWRSERKVARLGDPLFCLVLGLLTMRSFSPILGLWWIFAGLSLRTLEAAVWRKQVERHLDAVDAYINGEVQAQALEQLNRPSNPSPRQAEQLIPTGIGPDIHGAVERRKAQRPGLN